MFFILFGFFFNIILISSTNLLVPHQKYNKYYNEEYFPELSAPLSYSDISLNNSYVYRWFDPINITVNTTNFPYANYTVMQISFTNGSVGNYDMVSVGNNKSSYIYKPGLYAPKGVQNVSFLIYNEIGTLLNDHTTYDNFTIDVNCLVSFNSFEYYIGDTLYAELIVNNFNSSDDTETYVFQWDLTIVDSMDEATQNNLLALKSNVSQFILLIDNETFQQVNTIYYLKVNMTDKNYGKKAAAYFPFNIKNSNPIITSTIELSPDEIFRTEQGTVSINVTDIETAGENLTVTLSIQDSEGINLPQDVLVYEGGNSFSEEFTIPLFRPIGRYRVIVTAMDEHGGIDSKESFLTVKNNSPEINGYTINGKSMNQSISILYGRNLVFSFNVSDVEGVEYVTVALIDENNVWFNMTRAYEGEDTEITIRTIELITGIWFVYIYVIDSDGAITSLIDDYNMAPQGIRIIPDVLSTYLPLIIFFIGLVIGILAGIGSMYRYFKSKFVESQAVTPKKKKIPSKKPITKKKVKAKLIKEELEKEEIEELKPEEQEKEGIPKRKIKRKL